jgi:hypothetical protein
MKRSRSIVFDVELLNLLDAIAVGNARSTNAEVIFRIMQTLSNEESEAIRSVRRSRSLLAEALSSTFVTT